MILKAREAKQVLPEHVEPHSTRLFVYPEGDPKTNLHSGASAVLHVPASDIYEMAREVLKFGMPTLYAIVHNHAASTLHLYPVPDRDYHALLRYNPVAREI